MNAKPAQHDAINHWLGPKAATAATMANIRQGELRAYGATVRPDGTVIHGYGADERIFPNPSVALQILAHEHTLGVECVIGADGLAHPKGQ